MGRPVPAVKTPEGSRAASDGRPISPESVERYVESKFGEALGAARDAMKALAGSMSPRDLRERAFGLYEEFRPKVPPGKRGWGAGGALDLGLIRAMARSGSR